MPLFFTVRQSHCVIIERLGKYSRTCKQGLHFKIPIIESVRTLSEWEGVATKRGFEIELTEQHLDTRPRGCHTRDNVSVTADASIYWRITNPIKAVYDVDVLPSQISDSALNALRAAIGKLELDEVLSQRKELSEEIARQLAPLGAEWGIIISRVEIQELTTEEATSSAMRQQMEGERRRRSMVAEAAGRAEAEVAVARAEREASILRAEGIASALETITAAETAYIASLSEKLSTVQVARLLMAQKVLDGFEKISKNPAHKVFLPSDYNAIFTLPMDEPGATATQA